MRIKLKSPILDYENKPIKAGEKELTIFDVIINALNMQSQDEKLTAEKKNEIYQLTRKIYKHNEPNFTPEQLTLIKERVGLFYAPVVYGRIKDLVDGVQEIEEEKKEESSTDAPQEESTSN